MATKNKQLDWYRYRQNNPTHTLDDFINQGGTFKDDDDRIKAEQFYGTAANVAQASNAGSNSMKSGVLGNGATGDPKETAQGKQNIQDAADRDKLGVLYGKTDDPELKKQIADTLNAIDNRIKNGQVDSNPPPSKEKGTGQGYGTWQPDWSKVYNRDEAEKPNSGLLILDSIGTMLKNMGQQRSYIGTAFGTPGQERQMGDEKSLAQKAVEENVRRGVERRNTRLDAALQQQMKQDYFPANLQMKVTEWLESGKANNKTKVDLINRLSNVDYATALSAYITQNPTKPIELAISAVDAMVPDSLF